MGKLRVTPTKQAKGKKSLSPQEAFAKLWKQVQTEQALLAQQPHNIQQFYNTYLEALGPLENQWCMLQEAEIYLLLSHWERKSLRDRERVFLVRYIADAFAELKANPFRTIDISELEELLVSVFLPEEDLELPKQPVNEDMFAEQEDDEADEDFTAEYFAEDEEDADLSQERQQRQDANELFNATTLNKMFRQLSKVLHPDLEQDEAVKQHKHELMAQLLNARDKQDVGAIVALYSQHIGADGAQFAPEDFPRLTLLLKKQLRELQQEKQLQALQSGLAGVVYQRFHHKNPNRQKTLLMQRRAVMSARCEEIEQSLAFNATVKNLRSFLNDWADEQMDYMFSHLYDE